MHFLFEHWYSDIRHLLSLPWSTGSGSGSGMFLYWTAFCCNAFGASATTSPSVSLISAMIIAPINKELVLISVTIRNNSYIFSNVYWQMLKGLRPNKETLRSQTQLQFHTFILQSTFVTVFVKVINILCAF